MAIKKKQTRMSKGYAFTVAPLHVSNELIKPNEINYFREKILIEEANSQDSFSAKTYHHFNILHRPHSIISFYCTIKQNLNKHVEASRAAMKLFTGTWPITTNLRHKKNATNKRLYLSVSISC